jgi:uncharacterized protein YutE (UPF0331/DUF86 family)
MMEHAIEHLKTKTEKDRWFAVLHADNAVELILKELARSKGIRVINKKGYSLDYYECIDHLVQSGLKIPELSSIDLLHTERNNNYHLGSKPDENKAEWLVYDVALSFVRKVCKEELNYDISTFSKEFKLSVEIEQDIELTRDQMVNQYLNDATYALKMGMFESTVMMSYIGIEALLREHISAEFTSTHAMMKTILERDILPKNLLNEFERLRITRNYVAHGMARVDEKEAKFALAVFRNVIDEIGLPLELKCKICGVKFKSGITMSRKAFETLILTANKHECPRGHVNSYDKKDYIVKL